MHTLAVVTYDQRGEDRDLYFSIAAEQPYPLPSGNIMRTEGGVDAAMQVTIFEIDLDAQKDRENDTWYTELEEETPGIVMGCARHRHGMR